ncbi:IdeS/Mac family cysteine endopeptidase [Ureaplasma canigenitalium]|uniref:IdeS/Mac family cysteine endopeptidase n=1 Tax=Ureaplasma canigenitalium TaxID=42092 RepID=UPI0004E27033|nr:IdeS/Mac family cysteine endopeptidase [Ureaplasma canigenitalium]
MKQKIRKKLLISTVLTTIILGSVASIASACKPDKKNNLESDSINNPDSSVHPKESDKHRREGFKPKEQPSLPEDKEKKKEHPKDTLDKNNRLPDGKPNDKNPESKDKSKPNSKGDESTNPHDKPKNGDQASEHMGGGDKNNQKLGNQDEGKVEDRKLDGNKGQKPKKSIPFTPLVPGVENKEIIPGLPLSPGKKNNKEKQNDKKEDDFFQNHPAFIKEIPGVKYSVFLDGVKFAENSFGRVSDDPVGVYKHLNPRNENDYWFDTNKEFNRNDNALCAAITAANWLDYWFIQNKDYIKDYLKDETKGKLNITLAGQSYTADIRELMEVYVDTTDNRVDHKVFKSKIFDFFLKRYGGTFVNPNMLVDHYLNGYPYNAARDRFGGQNYHSRYDVNTNYGFFREVFGKNILTKLTDARNTYRKKALSEAVIDALKNKRPMAISHSTLGKTTGHIINVWGADFDENQNVVGFYITNSDDPNSTYFDEKDNKRKLANVVYYYVHYNESDGKIHVGQNPDPNSGADLWDFYSLDLGQQYFKDYLAKKKESTK